ncbi:MAG: DUF327 family protein [Endomicrobium sp.]|jgi:uncharacterized protein YaaR (DUF327 family)|nr:DUF327 family protein [Endomicrobium sp.]
MERVEFTSGNSGIKNDKEKKIGKKNKTGVLSLFGSALEPKISDFSFYLSSVIDENISLEELLDDVHQLGEKLIEKPFISNIKDYKKAVRRFLGYVVKNTFEAESKIEKKQYFKNGNPHIDEKKWTNIKVVDEKLEKLALYIVQNQKGQLTILKKIEEIEGILFDLMR